MVNNVKEKLNGFHIALLIYMIELDITIFSLPRLIAENFGTNGWIGLIGLFGVAMFNIYLYKLVFKLGKGRSAFAIVEAFVPKALLYPIYTLLALFWLTLGAFVGKHFILIFQMISFQTSSPMLIFLLFCILVYALLVKDIYSIGKANTLFFILSIWMVFLVIYFIDDWKLVRFTSFFFKGADEGRTLHDWVEVYTVFSGYELCLFLFPFVDKDSKLFKGVFIGQMMFTVVLLLTVWTSFGFFSFEQIKALQYPIINQLENIELPFINRLENLVYTFFLFSNLMSTVMYCYASLSTMRRIFPHARAKLLEIVIVCLVFAAGFIPQILRQSEALLRTSYFIEISLAFAIPVILIPLAWRLRSRKGGMTEE